MQGVRVGSIHEVTHGDHGAYYPILREDRTVVGLWFKLPTGTLGRIPAIGFGNGTEPEWEIKLNPDATVSVSPSILQEAIPHAVPPIPPWHGFLRGGVWEE
jgi:hypothetical protein